jgi:hypothetical protein
MLSMRLEGDLTALRRSAQWVLALRLSAMIDSVMAYLGLDPIIAGLLSLIWPMGFSWLPPRSAAAIKLHGPFPVARQWKFH